MPTRRALASTIGASIILRPVMTCAASPPGSDFGSSLADIERAVEARMGVAILDTQTGQRWEHRSAERFPLCSTFKVLACAAVLARVDAGQETLERRIRFEARDVVTYSPVTKDRVGAAGMTLAELCEAGLTQSDNTAGNLILASLGGPAGVTDFARSIGDAVTRLDRNETTLNDAIPGDPRDTTTPDAMVANLHALLLGTVLSERSRGQLTAWMVANRTGDAKLRAGLPQAWRIGDKTGGGDFGTMNDIAVIWPPGRKPAIVSVYMTDTKASFDDRNAAIAHVGQIVAAGLNI